MMKNKDRSPAIEASGLNIGFNGIQILKDVDFCLHEGEIHGVVGSNGAGKSTLMKILNGVYKKDSGTIILFGAPAEFDSPETARKAGIGMVFQDLSLIPTLTVTENIFLQTQPYRKGPFINNKRSNAKAQELLKMVGMEIDTSATAMVENLSSGQKQIVEIVKALANEPRIVIMDEPTASLTNPEIDKLFAVLDTLKKQGLSIIYITHYLQDIFKICDRVTVLRNGTTVLSRPTNKLDVTMLVQAMSGSKSEQTIWNRRDNVRSGTPLLEIRNLNSDRLHNISISAYRGEIVGIAGLLGSGRSELLHAIFGIDRIGDGTILIDGTECTIRSTMNAIKNGIALVPENRREHGLILDFSVADNITMPIVDQLKKRLLIDERKSQTIVDRYIRAFDVKTQGARQSVRFLSGGNQQKIVVAKCLASKSRILLLDDPTFGVDIHAKQEIMKIIRDYALQGNAVLFISSEFNEIAAFCDSIYIMKRGEITHFVDAKVTEDDILYLVQ